MNKIKANHLIFTRLQRNSFKFLFDRGLVFIVEAGKYVYQRKRPIKNNLYFVIHGELEYRHDNGERFGERVTVGFCVGEEVLFEKPAMKNRLESVVATTRSCVLQIDAKDFLNMAKRPSDGGGSTAFREDRELLMDLMRQLYFVKSYWRYDAGVDGIPTMM